MKRGTPNHPKVYNLMALLKISRPAAIGYLELLFHFAAEYAPDGHLGRYSVARIEAAMDWRGGANRLVAAMWGVGFVDMDTTLGLCLHDYEEHADGVVHKRLSRAGKCFVKVTEKVTAKPESLTAGIQSVTEEFKSLTMNCVPRARGPIQSNPYTPPTPSTCVEGDESEIPLEGRDRLFAVEDTRANVKANSKSKRNGSSEDKLTPQQHQWFDEFWENVWAKTAVGAAKKAYGNKVRDEQTAANVLAAVKKHADFLRANKERQYWPHPSTWLNGERWLDELPPADTPTPAAPQSYLPEYPAPERRGHDPKAYEIDFWKEGGWE